MLRFFYMILLGIGLVASLGFTFTLVDRIYECWFEDKEAGPFVGLIAWVFMFAVFACVLT